MITTGATTPETTSCVVNALPPHAPGSGVEDVGGLKRQFIATVLGDFSPAVSSAPAPYASSIASSSVMSPSIMSRPMFQKAGSRASRPKGFSNSS